MSDFGFLNYPRKEDPHMDPSESRTTFEEFRQSLSHEERLEQAARCMNCGVPFCQSAESWNGMVTGCPLHNLIPEWNEELCNGNDHYALMRLLKTNPFPEFTSRVCPALCEKACLNRLGDGATAIHDNEFWIIENGFKQGWMKPVIPEVRSGKKVAVIGSGPAGLAVAHMLNQRGHLVTVFERDSQPGGLLHYGIPNMKLDKSVLKRRFDLMEAEGITFVTDCSIETEDQWKKLENEYDALIIAAGARKPRPLVAKNASLDGVVYALDYLTAQTKALESGKKTAISARNKHVVILGGGDTGNDCLGTALRQQAKSVTQLEVMPEPASEENCPTAWPLWPRTKKTDYGQQEAIECFGKDPRIFSTTVTEVLEKNGKVHGVKIAQVDSHMNPIPETERTINCDLLVIAAGFIGVDEWIAANDSLKLTKRGCIETRPASYRIDERPIFACGDCRRGPSLVVWALSEGKNCAREVDHALMGYTNIEV